MKSKIALGLVLISLLFLLTLSALRVQQAKAQPPPVFPLDPPVQVYVDPPTMMAPQGYLVNASVIYVSPVNLDLCSWQLSLQWDPSILICNSSTCLWIRTSLARNNTAGQLSAYYCPSDPAVTFTPVSPSKVLTLTFQGVGYGVSSINITNFDLLGRSDTGNGWINGTDPYMGIPEFTKYDRWPDLDNDGYVDIHDALLFSGQWGHYWSACDFNNDSVVDVIDMTILISDFNQIDGLNLTNTIYLFNETIQNGSVRAIIPGDINGNGIVDIYDAIILGNAYNSKPGDSKWNSNADINGDNIVDIYDSIIQANHYNQHYP